MIRTCAAPQRPHSRLPLSLLLALLMSVIGLSFAESSSAADDGTISGRVTDEQGSPIPFARVEALDGSSSDIPADIAFTGLDGRYQLSGLPDDQYAVLFAGPDNPIPQYVPEYWNNQAIEEWASVVQIGYGVTSVTGIDATLDDSSTISGRVADLMGRPIPGTDVVLYAIVQGGWSKAAEVITDAGGNYSVILRPGRTYRVYFSNPDLDFAPEYWPHGISVLDGQDVALTEGEHVTGIDGSLPRASHITGTVLPKGGTHWFGGPDVYLDRKQGTTWDGLGASTFVDDFGHYDLGELHAGIYRVQFSFHGPDPTGVFSHWWDDAPNAAGATEIVVPAATTVSGIDARLSWGYRVVRALSRPVVRGRPIVGRTLHVSPGVWDPDDVQLSFTWFARDRVVGKGARLPLTRKLVGARVSVKVTARAQTYLAEKLTIRAPGRVKWP